MFAGILYGENTGPLSKDEEDVFTEIKIVSEALNNLGFKPVTIPFSLDIRNTLSIFQEFTPSFVFNLVESLEGTGKLIHLAPSILDYLKMPYTGASTDAIYLTSNKILAKKLLKNSGISTPSWVMPEEVIEGKVTFGPPYIIKYIWEDASVGIGKSSIVYDKNELVEEVKRRYEVNGSDFFIEAFIDGREFNISLLSDVDGLEILPPLELDFSKYPPGKPRIADYAAKWEEASFEYNNTPKKYKFFERDSGLIDQLKDISRRCWILFELDGHARVDFRVNKDGLPFVLEINVNPCLSPDSNFIASVNAAKLDFSNVIKRIIEKPLLKAREKSEEYKINQLEPEISLFKKVT